MRIAVIPALRADGAVEVLGNFASWHCLEGDPEWIGTDISFDLEEKDEETILRFTHTWREITEFYAHCNFQWGKYLVSLKEYCETGKGFPFNPINEKN